MILVLGNHDVASAQPNDDGSKTMQAIRGKRATTVEFPDEWTLAQCFRALTDGDGIIANHFTAGATPVWVASDNEALASLVSDNFNNIEVRDLETSGSAK